MNASEKLPLEPRLQPLRVSSGWRVSFINRLYEIDPPASEQLAVFQKKYFIEDLLLMIHDDRNRILDVGWYPDGDIEAGAYTIYVHEGDHWGRELHRFTTRDRTELVAEIERLFYEVTRGAL